MLFYRGLMELLCSVDKPTHLMQQASPAGSAQKSVAVCCEGSVRRVPFARACS